MPIALLPFHFPDPDLNTVKCWFQIRINVTRSMYSGGNISFNVGDDPAAVRENRRELMRHIGTNDLCELKQVHSTRIHFDAKTIPFLDDLPRLEGDGLTTTKKQQALIIKTADCQAILLAHKSGKYVAALHVGWRGNRAHFLGYALEKICTHYNLQSEDFFAVRGPSLGPDAAEFLNYDKEWGLEFEKWHNKIQQTVNLWQMSQDQLIAAGLRKDRIFSLDLCTFSLPEILFSYRRQHHGGRQAAIICIN